MDEVDLATALAVLTSGPPLRVQSMSALQTALLVQQLKGVKGTLVIQLPSDPDKPIEVSFTTGSCSIHLSPA